MRTRIARPSLVPGACPRGASPDDLYDLLRREPIEQPAPAGKYEKKREKGSTPEIEEALLETEKYIEKKNSRRR